MKFNFNIYISQLLWGKIDKISFSTQNSLPNRILEIGPQNRAGLEGKIIINVIQYFSSCINSGPSKMISPSRTKGSGRKERTITKALICCYAIEVSCLFSVAMHAVTRLFFDEIYRSLGLII